MGRALACAMCAGLAFAQATQPAVERIDLAERLGAGKIRAVNRNITRMQSPRDGVHLSENANVGLAWIDGTQFSEGTIEVDVRGKDVFQQSFLGLAFHGQDDRTYESVYLRPFNFRATDPARHQHAVQYMTLPDFDWPRLREQFPEEFENPVSASLSPTDWVPLRVVVAAQRVQIFAGADHAPALDVRKLGTLSGGTIGLWLGNGSDGDFANLRITRTR